MQTTKTFKKILIANRGEIACRVIKSARKMGIKTVAVYSDADDGALHMRMADEAVHIGPAPSADSYLRMDRIIAACKETGAEAVHPGYGFLSENTKFREALDAEGIVFIGPGPKAIDLMGDKITSKKFAAEAGVSIVPGHTETIKDGEDAVKIANDRDARRGDEKSTGSNRRRTKRPQALAIPGCSRKSLFEEPRHIEIQIIADRYGKALYLGERECSIQRRHQKHRRSTSPFLDEATRKQMGEQAVAPQMNRGREHRSRSTSG